MQLAPLFDDGLIKLAAKAIRPISFGCQYRLELCARPFRLPAAVSDNSMCTCNVGHYSWRAEGGRVQLQLVWVAMVDLADGPGRELDQAVVKQRRELHRTRDCLSCRWPVLLQNVEVAACAAVPLVRPSPW